MPNITRTLLAVAAMLMLQSVPAWVQPALSAAGTPTGFEKELNNYLKGIEKKKPLNAPTLPGGKNPHEKLTSDKTLLVALRHLHGGKVDEAVKTLDFGISQDPRYHKFYGLRASIHLSKSRFGAALGDLKEALDLNPDDPLLLVHRSLAYRGFGNNNAALADLNRAIELDPKMMVAWYNRAALSVKLGNMEQAAKDYARAAEIAPQEPVTAFNHAMALKSLGKNEKAITEMKRLASIAKSSHWKKQAKSHLKKWQAETGAEKTK